VTYGADYSARELAPQELDGFRDYDLRFLMRYIGYPGNPKCISHYPGAYQALTRSGRKVLLVHELGTADMAGGWDAGVSHARTALADARSVGYPETDPIFFCADGWLSEHGIPVGTAMSYLDGVASVIGWSRTGAYGFNDTISAVAGGNHARWRWLCGAAPTDQQVAAWGVHIYQWNNGSISVGGMACDLNWSYVDPFFIGGAPAPAAATTSSEESVATIVLPPTDAPKDPKTDPSTWPRVDYTIPLAPPGGWHGKVMAHVVVNAYYDHDQKVAGFVRFANWFVEGGDDVRPVSVADHVNDNGVPMVRFWAAHWGPAPQGSSSLVLNYAAPHGAAVTIEYER
jgi:hypothetical protein